jgi:hypothetical protein
VSGAACIFGATPAAGGEAGGALCAAGGGATSGGSTSPLEEHAEFLLGLISEKPDLTLDEVVAAMGKRRIFT